MSKNDAVNPSETYALDETENTKAETIDELAETPRIPG
jgi:hypothetical protein